MNRRKFLEASAALPLTTAFSRGAFALGAEVPFNGSYVRELARNLAAKPFEAPDQKLPDAIKDLDYDQYRSIRFLPERALWRSEGLPFEVQFFHRGFLYKNRVGLYEVANGRAAPIRYRRDDFSARALA